MLAGQKFHSLVLPAKSNSGGIPGTPSFCSAFGREQEQSVYTEKDPHTAHGRRDSCTLSNQNVFVCVVLVIWGTLLEKRALLFPK